MRRPAFLLPLLLLPALPVCAAPSLEPDVWLMKREVYTREAERLQEAYLKCSGKVDAPSREVVVPVDTYDDGALKLVLSADKAQVFFNDEKAAHRKIMIWAESVLIRKLEQDGTESARIEARHCLVDTETKSGWIAGDGRIVQGKTSFTGKDLYFSSSDGYMMSLSNTVLTSTDLKFGGAL